MENFDRLDRIEALVEKIGQRVDSNARAIEAIAANTAEYQAGELRETKNLPQHQVRDASLHFVTFSMTSGKCHFSSFLATKLIIRSTE